jgi:hypothetical protein
VRAGRRHAYCCLRQQQTGGASTWTNAQTMLHYFTSAWLPSIGRIRRSGLPLGGLGITEDRVAQGFAEQRLKGRPDFCSLDRQDIAARPH